MRTKIITDAVSDISKDVAEQYDIEVMPICVSLDGSYVSSDKLEVGKTVKWIEDNKKIPDIKGVSAEEYAKVFEKYTKQGMEIVCVTAGSKSISNYDCACHASTRFPDANIQVFDSRQVAGATGLMAIKAAVLANNDESANAISIQLERNIEKYRQYGLADSVTFLQYAGLCPKLVAVGSNLLNAKYEFEMQKDRGFDVQILGNSMSRAIPSYCTNVFKDINSIDPKRVFLMHTVSDEDYFAEVYRRVIALNYFEDIIVCNAGHYSNCMVGRNGIGVAYQLK